MDKVCCVVNFEGFNLKDKFLVREFGWVNTETGQTGVHRFNLRPFSNGLTEKERSTIHYTENRLHGLPFCPGRGENTLPLDLLNEKIMEVHNRCKKDDKDIVAYKGGGQSKQDILKQLKIPFRNLEEFGCPKFGELAKYHARDSCGFHQKNLPCSESQVVAYKCWLLDNMHEIMQPREGSDSDDSSYDDFY